MRIEEKNGVFLIFEDHHETIWAYNPIDPDNLRANRPKLRKDIKEWWDVTAPGEWTTSYTEKYKKAIVIRDGRLFQLFKLAWNGREDIQRATYIRQDAAMVYAPYIPLKALQTPPPVFDTKDGLDGDASE